MPRQQRGLHVQARKAASAWRSRLRHRCRPVFTWLLTCQLGDNLWRFYGVHRLEKRYGGKVVLIGGRLCCRASAGGSPCAFAREFGSFFFLIPAVPPRPLTSARMPVSTLKACAMCVQAWRASVHSSECVFAFESVCPVCPFTFPSLRLSMPVFLRLLFCRSPVQRHDRSKPHVLLRS